MTDSYLIGPIWETYLFSDLRKYLSAIAPEASIWFYRDQSRQTVFLGVPLVNHHVALRGLVGHQRRTHRDDQIPYLHGRRPWRFTVVEHHR